jgi:hypothetical protein
MKRTWRRLSLWLAAPLLVGGPVLMAHCWSHRVWSVNQWRIYQAMERECHPAWRSFHYGRVGANDPVEEVIARTEPVRVERSGRWVVLKYQAGPLCFTGLTAVAYDGRMVGAYAWSCTWVWQFFDIMSEEQRAEFFRGHYDQPARVGNAVIVR